MKTEYFSIFSMPRSASTSARVWLNRQDNMICHGEILGPLNVRGTSKKQKSKITVTERNKRPNQFLETYFTSHKIQHVGFKALTSHLIDQKNLVFLQKFVELEPKIVLLYREDLVERFKSMALHRFSKGFFKEQDILKLNANDVLNNCISMIAEWQIGTEYWKRNLDTLKISQANLFNDNGLSNIAEFIGFEPGKTIGKSNSSSSRLTDKNSLIIRHLSEICEAPALKQFRKISV